MKCSSLKRKRKFISPNSDTQRRITKYFEKPSSTPIMREIDSATVPKEKLRNKLIQRNLTLLLSNDIDKEEDPIADSSAENISTESKIEQQCIEKNEKSHPEEQIPQNIVEQQNLVGDVDTQSAVYWHEKSKFWQAKAKTYKQQLDFSNKLLMRKLREIESLKKMSSPKVEPEKESGNFEIKKELLFKQFENYFSTDLMFVIRSVCPGSINDRKFVKYCLKGVYEGRREVLMNRTLGGRTKQKLTPEKLKVLKDIFRERIDSENEPNDKSLVRYKSLFRNIPNTLIELAKEHQKKMEQTISDVGSELNSGITHNQSIAQNSQAAVPPADHLPCLNTSIPAQNMVVFIPNIHLI